LRAFSPLDWHSLSTTNPFGRHRVTKKKGSKKAKLEFTVKRIERKKTRHLKTAPATASETQSK
jgi:hypothetical protein